MIQDEGYVKTIQALVAHTTTAMTLVTADVMDGPSRRDALVVTGRRGASSVGHVAPEGSCQAARGAR